MTEFLQMFLCFPTFLLMMFPTKLRFVASRWGPCGGFGVAALQQWRSGIEGPSAAWAMSIPFLPSMNHSNCSNYSVVLNFCNQSTQRFPVLRMQCTPNGCSKWNSCAFNGCLMEYITWKFMRIANTGLFDDNDYLLGNRFMFNREWCCRVI